MQLLKQVGEALLATLFPIPCRICNQLVETYAYGIVCQTCWHKVVPLSPQEGCQRCGYPYRYISAQTRPLDCGRCRPLTFTRARACGRYQGALRAIILQLKYRPYICAQLIELLKITFQQDDELPTSELILPVPLHSQRLRERGFNQAETIAAALAQEVKLPLDRDSLVRIKPTAKHRAGMDRIDRSASVVDAFQVLRPRLIAGTRILLIDDLFTTGCTLSACAKTLLNAGAASVSVLTLARVIDPAAFID
ncbi:MAG: ComF family protein [Acidobacteriota bacterium]